MPQFNWSIFSYIGLFFAIIYRFPQISKIYRTKSAEDLSSYSYLTHNGAYISFILYLVGSGKTDEWILCLYYFLGLFQNFLIFAMKLFYSAKKNQTATTPNGEVATTPKDQVDPVDPVNELTEMV